MCEYKGTYKSNLKDVFIMKTTLKQVKSQFQQFDVELLPEMIDKTSTSFKIASRCVGTTDIYNPSVLNGNKLNCNFQLHFRNLEIDTIGDMLEEVLSPVAEHGNSFVRVIRSYYGLNFKVRTNVALGDVLDALPLTYLDKTSFNHGNGEFEYIYNFNVELTNSH